MSEPKSSGGGNKLLTYTGFVNSTFNGVVDSERRGFFEELEAAKVVSYGHEISPDVMRSRGTKLFLVSAYWKK